MKERQTTLNTAFALAGRGLHTGLMVRCEVKPAEADTGIIIVRTDMRPQVTIPALAIYGDDCARGTVLAKNGAKVTTLEHLVSALHGFHIDNAVIELNGPEVPILDGSALPWVEQIRKSGIATLDAERRYIEFAQPIEAAFGSSTYKVVPADDFQVRCTVDFGNSVIGRQQAELSSFADYEAQIAPCRTFCFLHEVEPLLKANLIKGGDLDNALVYVNGDLGDEMRQKLSIAFNKPVDSFQVRNGLLNTTDQTFANEPARHKLLDFVGDIRLIGQPVKGHFDIVCPGHKNNLAFVNHILKTINTK